MIASQATTLAAQVDPGWDFKTRSLDLPRRVSPSGSRSGRSSYMPAVADALRKAQSTLVLPTGALWRVPARVVAVRYGQEPQATRPAPHCLSGLAASPQLTVHCPAGQFTVQDPLQPTSQFPPLHVTVQSCVSQDSVQP